MTDKKLPTIQELHSDIEMKIKENDFNILMNYDPNPAWVLKHPHGNFHYIPIERVEWLLTRVMIHWHVEIKEVKLLANSVVVTVRLHYSHPVKGDMFQDGVGAAPLQTAQGAGAIDFNKMKTNAVQLAAPSAESYAVKDAAEKIGRLFGKDINRKDIMSYNFGDQFDTLENVSPDKVNYLESLLRNSTYDDEQKKLIEDELFEMTNTRADFIINNLLMNQMDDFDKENISQKTIQNKLDNKLKDEKA